MLSSVSVAIVNFLRWWLSELKGIFSAQARFGADRYAHRLVLSIEGEGVRILDERANQVVQLNSMRDGSHTLVDAVKELAEISNSQPRTPIGLRFSNQDCFVRQVDLPFAARNDIGKVLDLDLERTTPFRRDDVFAVHYIENETPSEMGKLAVHQLVIKRDTVETALGAMSQAGIEPDFADCWNQENTAPLPVDFLLSAKDKTSNLEKGVRLIPGLMAVSVALALTAIVITFIRHENALDDITAATASAKAQAHIVRQAIDKSQTASARISSIQRLRQKRVSAARILEELTTVIPDSAWLSDFRIEGTTIEFTGYAKSAASLIPLIEESKLFSGASLTAPVMLDARHDKERFSIRVGIRYAPTALKQHGSAGKVMNK